MVLFSGEDGFHDHSGEGEGPHHGKKGPAAWTAQGHQRQWGVGPGDEEVDAGVVEPLEKGLRAMAAEADGSDVRMGERKALWSNDVAEVRRMGEDLGHELLRRRAG